ncbi:RcpC/CpaB family pilus assembly protein [Streptomyces sp. DW26H14]|uniref:RcpC/CpaB family pilus assembly protein n=1 Tax=Streptomyces sp. DW26H14 TaxID=3435395 RepID=UPI00403D7DB1
MAAGLAVTAAALAATGAGATGTARPLPPGPHAGPRPGAGGRSGPAEAPGTSPPEPPGGRIVSAPVRIADAATVALLHPGDLVDVIATPVSPTGDTGSGRREPTARIVATSARVERIPDAGADGAIEGGALLVLSVPRAVAAELASAGAVSQLAVTLC